MRPTYLLAALSLFAVTGCSQQTINSANKDADHNMKTIQQKVQQVAREAKPQAQKLDLGARVTAAITAAHIHGVRVDADSGGVSLHGTVASSEQKARAGRIARDTLGPGKSVDNQLQVKDAG